MPGINECSYILYLLFPPLFQNLFFNRYEIINQKTEGPLNLRDSLIFQTCLAPLLISQTNCFQVANYPEIAHFNTLGRKEAEWTELLHLMKLLLIVILNIVRNPKQMFFLLTLIKLDFQANINFYMAAK